MKIPISMGRAGTISLGVIVIVTFTTLVSILTGYYWLVPVNGSLVVSFDKRPLQDFGFGVMVGSTLSLLAILVLSRKRLFPALPARMFARILAITTVWSWALLGLSYAENVLSLGWVVADILLFTVTLGALILRRSRLPKRGVLLAIVLALAVSLSVAVPSYASAQRNTLWAGELNCDGNRCPFGIADPTSPGPPWGSLVQGRIYDFYFDVFIGRVQVMLNAEPGTGNTTYWNAGGVQGLSNWNGIGVNEFEWSPAMTGFYQIVLSNQNYPSGSIVMIRVTSP